MPIPWMFALKSIPWGTIVSNAPSIVRSAETLLSRSRRREPDPVVTSEIQTLARALAELEERNRATAELLTGVTAQMTALATATEVLEARLRWLFVMAGVSAVVAIAAVVIAVLAW